MTRLSGPSPRTSASRAFAIAAAGERNQSSRIEATDPLDDVCEGGKRVD